jgi:hypothetical protein
LFGQTAQAPEGEEFINTAEYKSSVCGKEKTSLADRSDKLDMRTKIRCKKDRIAIRMTFGKAVEKLFRALI